MDHYNNDFDGLALVGKRKVAKLLALVSGPLLLSTEAAKKPTFYVKILGPLVTYSIEERPCSIDI
ncbi:hypothetical protein WN944_021411 [Citrus x changshan-huyou]|uniref:Uncharacterized protein n=1 Tax=Citrus x changshan-huyou TaxID=2935761 RepID=A0AAP0MWT1_9ROSI